MFKYIIIAILFAISFNSKSQTIIVKGYTVSYNKAAAEDICFRLNIDKDEQSIALVKDAKNAILFIEEKCKCTLSDLKKALIFFVAKEEIPNEYKSPQN